MSKVKRAQQPSEPLAPPKLQVDPQNMVALRSAGGHIHLVDRNCAMVSRRCQEYLEAMEREVLRGVEEGAEEPPTATTLSTALFYSVRACRDELGSLSGSPGGSRSHGGAGDAALREVPLAVLLEGYQRRLLTTGGSAGGGDPALARSEARLGSNGGHHRHTSSAPNGSGPAIPPPAAWSHAFASFEDPALYGELRLYPVIDLPDVPAHLVELSIDFMYYKYRADTDVAEKRLSVCAPSAFEETSKAEQLIAASVMMGL